MTRRERMVFWGGLLAALLVAMFVLRDVLVPFVAAGILEATAGTAGLVLPCCCCCICI